MKELPAKVTRIYRKGSPAETLGQCPRLELSQGDITAPVAVDSTSAVVVGPQVTGFMDGVEPTLRSTVSQSMLLASLVAQQTAGGGPEKTGVVYLIQGHAPFPGLVVR